MREQEEGRKIRREKGREEREATCPKSASPSGRVEGGSALKLDTQLGLRACKLAWNSARGIAFLHWRHANR